MNTLFYILSSAAVLIAIIAWFKVTALRRRVPGGIVKATCNILGQFIGVFTIGFLAFTLFPVLPEEARRLLVSLVFVCAAAFSMVVIKFFNELAADNGF